MKKLLQELKRRRVFQVAVTYIVVTFGILQAADIIQDSLSLPE